MNKSQIIGVVSGLILSTIGLTKDNQPLTILGAGLFVISTSINAENKNNKSVNNNTLKTSAKEPEILIPVIEKPIIKPKTKPIPKVQLSSPSKPIVTKVKTTNKPKPVLKKGQTN